MLGRIVGRICGYRSAANLLLGLAAVYCSPGCGGPNRIDGTGDSHTDIQEDTEINEVDNDDIDVPDDAINADGDDISADGNDVYDILAEDDVEEDGSDTCPDDMVYLSGHNICIDRYEASRPDATSVSQGTASGSARSIRGVIPWSNVTWLEADAACRLAGKRLCSRDDWMLVCTHNGDFDYPYGPDFIDTLCWGASSGVTEPQPTESRPCECVYEGVFDMSGNVAEWLDDCSSNSGGVCMLTQSYFGASAENMICDMVVGRDPELSMTEIGFRCCL